MIDQLLAQLAAYVANLFAWLVGSVNNMWNSVINFVGSLLATMMNQITAALNNIYTFIGGILTQLQNLVTNIVNSIQGIVERVVTTITTAFEGLVNRIRNLISDVFNYIGSIAQAAVNNIAHFVNTLIDSIEEVLGTVVGAVQDFIQDAVEAIAGVIGEALQAVEDAFNGVVERINLAWEKLITGADAIIETVAGRIGDLANAFGEAAALLVEGLADINTESLKPIAGQVKDLFSTLAKWGTPEEVQQMSETIRHLLASNPTPDHYRDFITGDWATIIPRSPFWRALFGVAIGVAAAYPTLAQVGGAYASVQLQEIARAVPYNILTAADAVNAWRRGFLTEEAARDVMARQGFHATDQSTMMQLTDTLPADGELLAMWLREILSDETIDTFLDRKGYAPFWAEKMKMLAQIIPPVGDLITMAVRDVWNPQAVSTFQLSEGFPQDFGEWAAKQGLSKDWALKYWQAHWALPSATQGFEMFHRRLIDDGELNLLLQTLDVSPFWRDKLKGIAYNVLTRVDVRRMHQLGILDDEGVYNAHLDMGYSPDHAEVLTAFVIRLNSTAPTEADEDLGRLSRAAILGFYRDGVIDRVRAVALLMTLGHTAEAAGLLIDSEDMDRERQERKAERDLIIEMAQAGTITFAEAQDGLNGLGLTTLEVQRALTELIRAEQKRIKLPSIEQATALFKAGIILESDFRDALSRLGYAVKWIDAFVRLAKVKKDGR